MLTRIDDSGFEKKRQRAAALQKLRQFSGPQFIPPGLAVRQPSGALRMCVASAFVVGLFLASCAHRNDDLKEAARTFSVKGVVEEIKDAAIVVDHEEIPGYMDAMTMPFKVKERSALEKLEPDDRISFRLVVTETESWIENIEKVGRREVGSPSQRASPQPAPREAGGQNHPLREYRFTNELGQPVTLNSFKGKALAITFFFTRCPIPDYCPRLSKNFQQAQKQLASMPQGPTNWHLLSVTIDPEHDAPAVLKSYGERYQYDPAHWSFLTGPKEKIAEFAHLSDVTFEWQGNLLNHNFRTLIIDPAGELQMTFPISGDISSSIVEEIIKAAAKK